MPHTAQKILLIKVLVGRSGSKKKVSRNDNGGNPGPFAKNKQKTEDAARPPKK